MPNVSPDAGPGSPLRQAVRSVLSHPTLAVEAVRVSCAHAPRGWWRRWPFVPVPDGAYMRWRVETAYGSGSADLDADDVVQYLVWRRAQRRVR